MPRSTRNLDMRMSDSTKPSGMASGNAQATMMIAWMKPQNTTGRLVTRMVGSRNSFRNLLEFHAWTQSCSAR